MIVAREVEVRVGARLLLSPASFQVGSGDRIGLVGRNGAGKTTLTRILAGEGLPSGGAVSRTGPIGYLPQDPRTGDLHVLARDRILSARGLDQILRRLGTYSVAMAEAETDDARDAAMRSYARAENELAAAGGYSAEAEAARIAANHPTRSGAGGSGTHSSRGMENSAHHSATVTNETRTASAVSARPNPPGYSVISTFRANSRPPPR